MPDCLPVAVDLGLIIPEIVDIAAEQEDLENLLVKKDILSDNGQATVGGLLLFGLQPIFSEFLVKRPVHLSVLSTDQIVC